MMTCWWDWRAADSARVYTYGAEAQRQLNRFLSSVGLAFQLCAYLCVTSLTRPQPQSDTSAPSAFKRVFPPEVRIWKPEEAQS